MAFKDNLVKIRQFRGMEPMDVVNGTGIIKQKYYAYEAGDYEPRKETLDLLSSFLQVPKIFFLQERITDDDLMELNKSKNVDDWYRQTIDALIHQTSETIRINNETIVEFRSRDKEEILSLRIDKDKLLDVLTSHFKPPQNGQ